MHTPTPFPLPAQRQRLPFPYQPEAQVLAAARARVDAGLDWGAVTARATPWVLAVRDKPAPFWAMESLLKEYPISSAEGLALMRLAEALLRVPDVETAIALTADQLGRADFDSSDSSGGLLANLSASAIALSKKFLPEAEQDSGLIKRLGARTVVAATVRAIQLLGRQFVLGRHIQEAMAEAASQRKAQPMLRFSYDMLGEGARTEHDAERYQAAYLKAIAAIAATAGGRGPESSDGISIKLSALFSRYEDAQRERVFAELLPRVWALVERAAPAQLNLTIDAEEVDRLELSLELLDALAERIALHYPQWRGFGLAVQAYQTRALAVVDEVARIARAHGLRFMVRLVKGAYWDGEVKRAQEMGLPAYPVYTRKPHTDVSYLACAQALLGHREVIYPQFATHNAGTIAAIQQMAIDAGAQPGADYEMQRLHGMGDGIYREVLKDAKAACRVYAPVGEHRDLLAYLVRRLLENGANSSFVHLLADAEVSPAELLASPLQLAHSAAPEAGVAEGLPLPADLYGATRRNSTGADITSLPQREPLTAAVASTVVPAVPEAGAADIDVAMARLSAGFTAWSARPVAERATIVRRAGDLLDARLASYCGLLVKEAHKTLGDRVAEVREAVDFCRYYADQAEAALGGPTPMQGRGVFVCISPWNFPLAIFAGQVVAALVAGNTVAAKPAEQTPAIAAAMVALLHEAGVPADALALLHGPGETVGAGLVADARTAGVCFTGSTQVARIIQRTLADKGGAPVPLIAETGGLNAMIVDSTALPEQVVDAVVQSAFRSAGQRCSALRLLCVHEAIADGVIEMIRGAMAELRVGDPAELRTDVGPVIDDEAFSGISAQVQRLKREAKLLGETVVDAAAFPRLVPPVAFELPAVSALQSEIFGPVLHVVRWRGEPEALVREINALGYGLTFGIQTRIDSRAERLAALAQIGNVYVNRNMIGAVVGVQPFGGEGMSGTGPKAGGPHYLLRFAVEPGAVPSLAPAPVVTPGLSLVATAAHAALNPPLQALPGWRATPLDQRSALLRRAADALAASRPAIATRWRALATAAETTLATVELPGPTGERNELRLHGRGLFAFVGEDAAQDMLAAAVGAALVTGNTVAWAGSETAIDAAKPWLQALRQAGLPAAVLQPLPGSFDSLGTALVADARVAGVCATSAAVLPRLAHQLAAQPGAILPLLSLTEATSPRQLYRFCAEQTLTVNTAAAGGNAALLAGL
ncbi:bifunctional proline dehydrogenase/L-glutamate gamma-semialdehyde dehydrogenase PutA [Ideonella azotifigens]|uniref:Bifunctional protein PutA n=5 Tax=Ideonella azotifigens TaxID=513160 RepID=A0ABP3UWH3_9BURK